MSFFGSISAREHYGLRLLLRLAANYRHQEPLSLAEVSEQEKISLKYLEQLITPFRRAGWVKSRRGRRGGYVLVKNPAKISLKEVMALLNGNHKMIVCLEADYDRDCPVDRGCSSKQIWGQVQRTVERSLADIALADFLPS